MYEALLTIQGEMNVIAENIAYIIYNSLGQDIT